jgi:hypothetical protein
VFVDLWWEEENVISTCEELWINASKALYPTTNTLDKKWLCLRDPPRVHCILKPSYIYLAQCLANELRGGTLTILVVGRLTCPLPTRLTAAKTVFKRRPLILDRQNERCRLARLCRIQSHTTRRFVPLLHFSPASIKLKLWDATPSLSQAALSRPGGYIYVLQKVILAAGEQIAPISTIVSW